MGKIGIYLIVILGLILRLLFINKPDGLWNDEYVSWMIAAQPILDGFLEGIKSQCHMPFYYLYLKFFMTLFGQSDLVLRLTSVFAGVLSIIAMYNVGLEKDRKTGLLCAGFTAISSFLIYYSQEVRFYSVLFLFSALTILFTIRTVKSPNKKNFILCAIFNFLVMFTHTIGFVFVFFNLIFISVFLYEQYKKVISKLWITLGISTLTLAPLIMKVITTQSFSQWWSSFSISKIGFLITDYFSPLLTNLASAPDNFFYNKTPDFFIFAIVPSLIALALLFNSLKNKYAIGLLGIALGKLAVLIIVSISGKLVFITKYSIEIYPILILLVCLGASSLKNKTFLSIIISLYCLLSFTYMIKSPLAAFKIRRPEGHKIMTDMLKNADLKEGDVILLEYYPQNRFEKYFDFSDLKVISINKGNFVDFLTPHTSYDDVYKNGKEIYKNIFQQNENKYFKKKLEENIFDNLKQDQKVVLVTLDSVSSYTPEIVLNISRDKERYKKEPLLFLTFSYIKNQTFYEMTKTLQVTRFEQKGSWTAITFTKLNETSK